MTRIIVLLLLLHTLAVFPQDDTERGDLHLSSHVAGYTKFVYDSLRISDLSKLNGDESLLRWIPTAYYRFNSGGSITEAGTFSGDIADVTKYRYDEQNRLREAIYYSGGVCYYIDLQHYNAMDQPIYRKRITCQLETSGFVFIDYAGDQVVAIRTVDKDSTTVLAKELREVNVSKDEISIRSYEGDKLLNHTIIQKSTGKLVSDTDFLLDSSIYYTYKYTYALDGSMLEQQMISVINDKTDTTWFMYETFAPGYRVMEYHRNNAGKVLMTEIDYYDSNNILQKTDFITKTRRVYKTIRHEFIYDAHGNWIYDITYHNSQPVSVVWRKLTYF